MLLVNIHEPKSNISSLIQKITKDEDAVASQKKYPLGISITIDDELSKRESGNVGARIKLSEDFESYTE